MRDFFSFKPIVFEKLPLEGFLLTQSFWLLTDFPSVGFLLKEEIITIFLQCHNLHDFYPIFFELETLIR